MANKGDEAKKPKPNGAWHAVHVASGPGACPAAITLGKRRFLSREAPRLPLADCTSPGTCQCAYKHHKDRREEPRRWRDHGGAHRLLPEGERRGKRGRRDND